MPMPRRQVSIQCAVRRCMEAIALQRLRFAARLLRAPLALLALVESEAGESLRSALKSDLTMIKGYQPHKLEKVVEFLDFDRFWIVVGGVEAALHGGPFDYHRRLVQGLGSRVTISSSTFFR